MSRIADPKVSFSAINLGLYLPQQLTIIINQLGKINPFALKRPMPPNRAKTNPIPKIANLLQLHNLIIVILGFLHQLSPQNNNNIGERVLKVKDSRDLGVGGLGVAGGGVAVGNVDLVVRLGEQAGELGAEGGLQLGEAG